MTLDNTPHSARWAEETARLHDILGDCGLTETTMWDKACFAAEGKNIAILQSMKPYLALMFYKGSLLSDPQGLLHTPGPNSRFAKRLHFTSLDDVVAMEGAVRAFVAESVALERAERTL